MRKLKKKTLALKMPINPKAVFCWIPGFFFSFSLLKPWLFLLGKERTFQSWCETQSSPFFSSATAELLFPFWRNGENVVYICTYGVNLPFYHRMKQQHYHIQFFNFFHNNNKRERGPFVFPTFSCLNIKRCRRRSVVWLVLQKPNSRTSDNNKRDAHYWRKGNGGKQNLLQFRVKKGERNSAQKIGCVTRNFPTMS